MLLDCFGSFFDCVIGELGGLVPCFISEIIYRKDQGEVILHLGVIILDALSHQVHAIPVYIVMGSEVMIGPPGPGIFLGGACTEKNCACE